MVRKLGALLFALGFFALGQAQTLTLDEATGEIMKYFSTKLPAGTKIVVLNVESDSKNLSEYVIEECGVFAVNNTKLPLVSKSGLPSILKEKNIGDLNEIDEALSLEIGKKLGASAVISASISKLGGNYKFRAQAVNTTNGQVLGIHSITIKQDEILSDLLAMGGASTAKSTSQNINAAPKVSATTKESDFSDLSSAKTSGGLGDAQSTKARLEAEMSDKSNANKTKNAANISTADNAQDEPSSYFSTTDNVQNKPSSKTNQNTDEKSYFWLSVKFQRFYNYFPSGLSYDRSYYLPDYDSHVVKPGSFDLEIGGIKPSGFTFYGITNFGPGNVGYGVFLGKTTLQSEIFRFTSGTDLGVWVINTQSLENGYSSSIARVTYGRVRENVMFGGPNFNFLIGHNPVFTSFGLKVLLGFYTEYDMANYRYDSVNYDYEKMGFTAMFSWNLGLTFTF